MIYGVALLAACMFVGSLVGNLLGLATGVDKDIGGVGFAMLLLILITSSRKANKILPKDYEKGINFWQQMYIPVTIAMAASQNVVSAMSGGIIALALGIGVVLLMLLLIPVFNKFNKTDAENKETEAEE